MIALRLLLFALVGYGFYGSGRLAWRELTVGEACPIVGSVPACYVAFTGYLLMAVALAVTTTAPIPWARRAFYAGVGIAGGLALLGTTLELIKGNICPRAAGIPMCFISLAMSVVIAGLYSRSTSIAWTNSRDGAGEQRIHDGDGDENRNQ